MLAYASMTNGVIVTEAAIQRIILFSRECLRNDLFCKDKSGADGLPINSTAWASGVAFDHAGQESSSCLVRCVVPRKDFCALGRRIAQGHRNKHRLAATMPNNPYMGFVLFSAISASLAFPARKNLSGPTMTFGLRPFEQHALEPIPPCGLGTVTGDRNESALSPCRSCLLSDPLPQRLIAVVGH